MIPLFLFALAGSSCLPLPPGADRITGRDLVGLWPAIGQAAAEETLGFAPAPGVQRIFSPAELVRIGTRLKIESAPPAPICVERATAPLGPAPVLEAMQQALPGAQIEILERSNRPAPAGTIVFQPGMLQASGVWHGYVEYAPGRRFPIWARVKVRTSVQQVVALEALVAGRPISAAAVKLTTVEAPPGPIAAAQSLDEVIGKTPRQTIPAGRPVLQRQLAETPEVVRGQVVKIQVREGVAVVEAEGMAQASGRRGDRVTVKNPSSGRIFAARVAGPALVVVGRNWREP